MVDREREHHEMASHKGSIIISKRIGKCTLAEKINSYMDAS